MTHPRLKIGGRYNWVNQPERLIYLGVEISNGPWHQFAKVDSPGVVWCEVRAADLEMFEATQPDQAPERKQPKDTKMKTKSIGQMLAVTALSLAGSFASAGGAGYQNPYKYPKATRERPKHKPAGSKMARKAAKGRIGLKG